MGYAEGEEKLRKEKEISGLKAENTELKSETAELKKGHELKDEKIRELEETIRLLKLQQTPTTELVTSRSDEPVKKTKKSSFDTSVKDNYHGSDIDKGWKWLKRAIDGRSIYKYEYLAVLIHLGIITSDDAYRYYPNASKRDDLFEDSGEVKKVYKAIKEKYEED